MQETSSNQRCLLWKRCLLDSIVVSSVLEAREKKRRKDKGVVLLDVCCLVDGEW